MKSTVLMAGFLVWGAVCAAAQSTNRLTTEELLALRLPDTQVESAAPVTESRSDRRSHLVVKGVIGGTIRFELLLPEEWNGRFVMGGGGGFVGTVQNAARDSVHRGYATVGTDTGHQWQPGYMAGWAKDNLEAQLNFGYLAVHRTAETAKALIRAYYRKEPAFSYFVGCSRGGGQALMEAQRYPQDFDGIVAGAPAFDWTGLAATMVSIAQELYPDPARLESTVLTKEALQKLQQSILEQCDAQDGVKDGIVQDPASASFELARVEGLTDEQRRALERIYQGARQGEKVISPGYPKGAEVDPDQWIAWLVGPMSALVTNDRVANLTFAFGTQVFKHLVFNDPAWDYSTYKFDSFEKDTRLAASFLNATNPNLDAFNQRKGKLIIWHGWADPALFAPVTVDYYRQVLAHNPRAAEYCRLFLTPGCLHCGGGPGASDVDWLAEIARWVEQGQGPDKIIASKRSAGKVVMTRPLFPYPATAVYKGSGDPNSADSFEMKLLPGAGN